MISGASPVMWSLAKFMSLTSLHEEPARELAERLRPGLGDTDRFRDGDAPIVEPDSRHEVEGHVRLEHGIVGRAERNRPLAPVRRIIEADGITAARVLVEAVTLDRARPGGVDVARHRTGLRG